MKKRYILALTTALPLAIALAATQGKVSTPASELAPTEAQALTGSLVYNLLSGSDYAYKSLPLDDALSAVDTGTETQILSHLRGELQGNRPRTAIIVSHRLSAVADADMIIVLKAGRVVERGSHDQLLSIDGWYAAQWRYQQLEASLEAA